MQAKEEKICSFTQKGTRLQLVKKIIPSEKKYFHYETQSYDYYTEKYEVRLNRKIIDTSLSEYTERKLFAQIVQNIVLQLKIY